MGALPPRTCPKVIISRLIPGDDGGARLRSPNAGNSVQPKVILSRLITGDDRGTRSRSRNAGNSVEPNSDFYT